MRRLDSVFPDSPSFIILQVSKSRKRRPGPQGVYVSEGETRLRKEKKKKTPNTRQEQEVPNTRGRCYKITEERVL